MFSFRGSCTRKYLTATIILWLVQSVFFTLSPALAAVHDKALATPVPILRPEAWPKLPQTNEKGFLTEGEFVHEDEEEGLWIYLSPSLRVEIQRVEDPAKPLSWYEAHIYSDIARGEVFKAIANDPEKWGKGKHVDGAKIAAENHTVFAMNSDYYTYRIARKITVGIVIRDRQIFSEKTAASPRQSFPNLDTLALYPDGRMEMNLSDAYTAQEYLDQGARDVFCFGPILLENGEIPEDIAASRFGQSKQPRCAIGMVEPGHYYAVLVEGRMNKVSVGENLLFLAHLMKDGGCENALNLDGGQTAVMLFMGKQITRIGAYSGGRTNSRTTTDILGIGTSPNTHPWEELKKKK